MADETIKGVITEGRCAAVASGAIVKGTAVKPTTTQGVWIECTAGDVAKGIANESVADGKDFSVTLIGGAEALAGAAIATPGTWLKATTDGKLIAVTTDADPHVAYSMGIATALNDMIPVFVLPGMTEV